MAALLDDGLSGELAAIGFEKVTFANGTDTWTTKIEAVTDKQRVTEDLALYGLAEPLALPKAP